MSPICFYLINYLLQTYNGDFMIVFYNSKNMIILKEEDFENT